MKEKLAALADQLDGELYSDQLMRVLYATDASAYSELPLAVAFPKGIDDLRKLITFAAQEGTSLIPRTAGTSLAGQVVGAGIVADVSRHFNAILELNAEERWVKVQPGVVRDELNMFLKPFGLMFGPETSTSNRAMIGGMVGNNSCGSNSLVYRSTREHTIAIDALLADGSEARFESLSFNKFIEKCEGDDFESALYRSIRRQLGDYANQQEIRAQFPKPGVERRNTGYAIDLLLETNPFTAGAEDFNFCKLIAGSEGTLCFITSVKLNLVPLPPPSGLLCVHFHSIDDALRANLIALQFRPRACELIDHYILECTRDNPEQSLNRFFVMGDPQAILIIELEGADETEISNKSLRVEMALMAAGLGYHFPLLFGTDTSKIWTLRKAGLGLLGNLPGDEKAVAVIEDTAVDPADLAAYVRDFNEILKEHGLYSVHYAHAGSGELHLRPIINLKTAEGHELFRKIAAEIAVLVKKYRGSLSGEHGDGRLRGEFIPFMIGEKNYRLLRELKQTWDPHQIFNPGKIVDTPPMDSSLRYASDQQIPAFNTFFRYHNQDVLQHAEQCNGSGDCRKSHLSGGTMCPSYMATHNERDTTRARANTLRTFLTNSREANRFDHKEIKEVMDLCLSCKACKSECPSTVDMAKLKAEFTQHYYDANGVPFRAWMVAHISQINRLGSLAPGIYNFVSSNRWLSGIIKGTLGFAKERSLPLLYRFTLKEWFGRRAKSGIFHSTVYFFCDEFSNYNDTKLGMCAIKLLEDLGYRVIIPNHFESGRAALSKGLLRTARKIAERNVTLLSGLINEETPLIGIEPSAILCFRDEYPDLVEEKLAQAALELGQNSLLIDEFLDSEMKKGRIRREQFTTERKHIKLHGHCQQKALQAFEGSKRILSFPENYEVEVIPSGCCGMAGSFGYEKEHYDISMQIGELVLFPEVRRALPDIIIAATGTSCREQIQHGTKRLALHPVEILYESLK